MPLIIIGSSSNPIIFTSVIAGDTTEHPDNPFQLWNDKDGVAGSVDARDITLKVIGYNIIDELVGVSDGSPDQTFNTAFFPIISDDEQNHPFSIAVGGTLWERVDDLSVMGALDEVYEFDFDTGDITFGDGVNGKIPTNLSNIEVTYAPQTIRHGYEIEQYAWLGVQSTGVVSNNVTSLLEHSSVIDTTHVQASHHNITSVTGVWLDSDPQGLGTNYYTSGSYNNVTGVITLGTALPSADTTVYVTYAYTIVNDAEPIYTQLGVDDSHTFENPIPSNNAKLIYLRLVPPITASPNDVWQIRFFLRLDFNA